MPFGAARIVACVLYAAAHYGVPPVLISSMLTIEGGGAGTVRHNPNGSDDLGWAQINTVWLPVLKRYGIRRDTLLHEPCVNVGVATWILRGDYLRCGAWRGALAAYNTGQCHSRIGARYAERVLTIIQGATRRPRN